MPGGVRMCSMQFRKTSVNFTVEALNPGLHGLMHTTIQWFTGYMIEI